MDEKTTPLLTDNEKEAIKMAGVLWGLLTDIVGNDAPRDSDLNELVKPIHQIQRTIMAQAAARAYPTEYRLLGEVIK